MSSLSYSPMRLLIVTRENEQDKAYGLGKTLQPLLQALANRGHHIDYFSKDSCLYTHQQWHPKISRWLRPILTNLAPAIAERIVQGIAAATRAIATHATHVWAHDPWLVWGIKLGLLRRKYIRRPFKLIVTEHGLGSFTWAVTQDGLDISDKMYKCLLKAERRVLIHADHVFIPSHIAKAALVRDLHLERAQHNISVMGYGRPEIELPSKAAGLRHFGKLATDQTLTVVAVGRLAPVKNFPLLIKACAQLEHKYDTPVQIIIAGGGDPQPLQDLAASLNLSHKPIIQFEADISWTLAAADLYVSTCAAESYGQANREALAAGLPVIAPSQGGSGEVLGLGAYLIPVDNSDQGAIRLGAAMAEVLNQPNNYNYWRNKAKQESGAWLAWEQIADHYEQQLIK
ncbi:glycosyltransferase family 4 protein [Oceanospirillum maris]|uniref:glycosyltransferase family 4 protein n=1 Tax=Oceanospirillum maris TaxID=64977 RepID=UPI0004230273|nr:glycosyltransferase family 4 protein [Oceanospirillum maris]